MALLRIECPVADNPGEYNIFLSSEPVYVINGTIAFQTTDGQEIVGETPWCRIKHGQPEDYKDKTNE